MGEPMSAVRRERIDSLLSLLGDDSQESDWVDSETPAPIIKVRPKLTESTPAVPTFDRSPPKPPADAPVVNPACESCGDRRPLEFSSEFNGLLCALCLARIEAAAKRLAKPTKRRPSVTPAHRRGATQFRDTVSREGRILRLTESLYRSWRRDPTPETYEQLLSALEARQELRHPREGTDG